MYTWNVCCKILTSLRPSTIKSTRVVSHLGRSDTPNITWIVSRLDRSDTDNSAVVPWVQSPIRPHNHRPLASVSHMLISRIFIYSTEWPQRKKYECQKYEEITDSRECGREHNLRFWWRWHQPFYRSRLSHTYTHGHTHGQTVSSIIVRWNTCGDCDYLNLFLIFSMVH